MKLRMPVLILTLTAALWAQTATQTTAPVPQQSTVPAEKTKVCCDKMVAGANGEKSCPRHAATAAGKGAASCCAGTEQASCCGGKDAKSCMKDDKMAASCCKGCGKDVAASCCDRKSGKECGKDCCSQMKSEKPA